METLSELEKGWLAGLIDGEGCLYARNICRSKLRKSPKNKTIEVRMDLQAVSIPMIDEVERLYSKIGLRYLRQSPKMFKKSTRPAHRIMLSRKNDLLRLLYIITPSLIVKKPEALRLLQYLEKSCLVKMYHADKDDLTLVSDMKSLKLIA